MSACVGVAGAVAIPPRALLLSRAVAVLLSILTVSTAIVMIALIYRSSLHYPLSYNEGWNAYWAHRAALGEAIYPSQDAMVFNNYPPLSFLLVGGLSRLGIDVWIVGRIVAWLSFAGCAVLIGAVLRALGTGRPAAMLGAVLFGALMATDFNAYLGMYDPQLTAHFGMLVGLYLLVRAGLPADAEAASHRTVIAAALVIVASGFIKHNLVALPAAITVWLALYQRDLLVTWLLAAVAGLAVGFLSCWTIFGADFIAGLATPRTWAWHNASTKLFLWFVPIALPVLAALTLGVGRFDAAVPRGGHDLAAAANSTPGIRRPPRIASGRGSMLLFLFVVFAFASGCFGLAGDGVAYNALFELVIACSLAIGFALGRVTPHAWIALAAVSLVAWSTGMAAAATIAYRGEWRAELERHVATADHSVALIAAQPGPALCEDLLLCYWAGKSFEVDVFNYTQAAHAGRRDEHTLLSRVEQEGFGAILLDPIDHRMPPRVQAAIVQHYRLVADLPDLYLRREFRADIVGR